MERLYDHYANVAPSDVLGIKERIEHKLSLDGSSDDSKEAGVSHQQAENTSHSTTEGNLIANQMSDMEEENEPDGSIMDRADVLFKYILRSFRKHYCKSF